VSEIKCLSTNLPFDAEVVTQTQFWCKSVG